MDFLLNCLHLMREQNIVLFANMFNPPSSPCLQTKRFFILFAKIIVLPAATLKMPKHQFKDHI